MQDEAPAAATPPPHGGGLALLLLQFSDSCNSRYFYTFQSEDALVKGFLNFYEASLRSQHHLSPQDCLAYTLTDLLDYISKLPDIAMLIKTKEESRGLQPRGRAWLRARVQELVEKQKMRSV